MEDLRSCKKCCQLLPISIFRKDRNYITYTCQPCNLAFLKEYRQLNKLKIKHQKDSWYQANKHLAVERYHNDAQNKLTRLLRSRLYLAIKNNQKAGSAVGDLGCSIQEFRLYMESKFQPGMTWDNWSINGWHIDHILPLSNFDLTKREELLKACHYTNMQPLWSQDNWSKGDKC